MHIDYDIFHLENGLKVIVHEDHSIPKAVVDVLYRVGSRDEDEGLTGFAHLFEHLMFEGSRHIPSYDTPLQKVGGQNNAFTTSDITNYYLSLPSNQLETGFWLESDRMLELSFSQEKLDIQKRVVIEEFKQRYLNQPYGDAHNRLRALAFEKHPYRWPTIGRDISHIEDATLENVKDFFFRFYAPNNATLVVAGDVHTDQVKELAEKWFGPIPRRTLGKHPLPAEPPQREARKTTVSGRVPYPAVYKMYHIPAHTDRQYFVADILTDLLSYGKSALLYQEMVKKRSLSPGVNAFSWGMHDPGVLSIDGKVSEGVSIEEYENGLNETLEMLLKIDKDTLNRVKNKLQSVFVMQKTTMLNRALALAINDSLGNPDLINTTEEIYQSITLNEVRNAAARYLRPENCSTLYYQPEQA